MTSLYTYDFSTLYTTLPHYLINDKHIDLIKRDQGLMYSLSKPHFLFLKQHNLYLNDLQLCNYVYSVWGLGWALKC